MIDDTALPIFLNDDHSLVIIYAIIFKWNYNLSCRVDRTPFAVFLNPCAWCAEAILCIYEFEGIIINKRYDFLTLIVDVSPLFLCAHGYSVIAGTINIVVLRIYDYPASYISQSPFTVSVNTDWSFSVCETYTVIHSEQHNPVHCIFQANLAVLYKNMIVSFSHYS